MSSERSSSVFSLHEDLLQVTFSSTDLYRVRFSARVRTSSSGFRQTGRRRLRPMPRNATEFSSFIRGRKALRGLVTAFVAGAVIFVSAPSVHAQQGGIAGATDQVNQVAQTAGVGSTDLLTIIGTIINVFLSLCGIILLGLILYAGWLWMTAGGDAGKIEKAQKYIKNAVIGLVIIASAFAIVRFVMGWLGNVNGGGTTIGGGTIGGGFVGSAGSLGGGIIESHYPPRDATGVARNTSIIVTFKRPVALRSIIQDYNDGGTPEDRSDDTVTEGINDAIVQIYTTADGTDARLRSDQVRVRFTNDRRTFVFRPVNPIGSATENVNYTVALNAGAGGVLLEDGTPAFTGRFGDGYRWSFEASTLIDTEPPRLIGMFPRAGTRADRNAIIQFLFSEAMDPTAVTGNTAIGFENMAVLASGNPVEGSYAISNEYRVVEFVPSLECGVNTCGETMYCLPEGGPDVEVIAHAATIEGTGPTAQFLAAGYDGAVDMAANSLDGNADGITQGRGLDDASWRFGLTNDINLDPPTIEMTYPPASEDDEGRSNVDPFEPLSVRFNSVLQGSTWNTDTATIVPNESPEYNDTFWWSTGQSFLTDANEPVTSLAQTPAKSEAFIRHRMYASSTMYDPFLFSGIRNAYQNCFYPAGSTECVGAPNCCLNEPSQTDCSFTP